jgi:hypothetical protein
MWSWAKTEAAAPAKSSSSGTSIESIISPFIAVTALIRVSDDVRWTSVPGSWGAKVDRMRTGMSRATAGRIVRGWSTLAPKWASSCASS